VHGLTKPSSEQEVIRQLGNDRIWRNPSVPEGFNPRPLCAQTCRSATHVRFRGREWPLLGRTDIRRYGPDRRHLTQVRHEAGEKSSAIRKLMDRPASYDRYRRTSARAGFLLLLDASRPLPLIAGGFVVLGLVFLAVLMLAPQPWPGACYAVSLEWRTENKAFGQRPVCLSRIPYAIGIRPPARETAATILGR
jgi:hypothetical protein